LTFKEVSSKPRPREAATANLYLRAAGLS